VAKVVVAAGIAEGQRAGRRRGDGKADGIVPAGIGAVDAAHVDDAAPGVRRVRQGGKAAVAARRHEDIETVVVYRNLPVRPDLNQALAVVAVVYRGAAAIDRERAREPLVAREQVLSAGVDRIGETDQVVEVLPDLDGDGAAIGF